MIAPLLVATLAFLAIVAFSVAVHEYGHIYVARALGWRFHGWRFYWYGVGVALEPPEGRPADIWKVALGGLGATAILVLVGWRIGEANPLAVTLYWTNVAILFVNLIPVPGSDGWHLFTLGRAR